MKFAVVLLFAIVLALAWQLNVEVGANSQQRNQIAELTSKLGDKTARENLELQEKCALQAMKLFNDSYYRAKDGAGSYKSHYNTKLNKCFVTMQNQDTNPSSMTTWTESLDDAFERREYAAYMWHVSEAKGNKDWTVSPYICKLLPSSSNERECHSLEEYKAFVATYME